MNKKEFEEKFYLDDVTYLHIKELWKWIEEYAIEMCDKQRRICAKESVNKRSVTYAPLPKELIK